MTEELKLCPFHREPVEPNIFQGFDKGNGNPGSGGYWATVECPECGNGFTETECSTQQGALELAIDLWNTRYKRTCKWWLEDYHDEANNIWTTGCGERFQWAEYGHPKCCPSCGAEVLDD